MQLITLDMPVRSTPHVGQAKLGCRPLRSNRLGCRKHVSKWCLNVPRAEQKQESSRQTSSPPKVPSTAPTREKPPEPQLPENPRYPLEINRAWISILMDKVIDSADDVLMHARRSFALSTPRRPSLGPSTVDGGKISLCSDKPVVLILGSGWAAHAVIKVIDTDKFCTVVVSPTNHFLFTPMLPSCAVGSIEFRSLLEPIRVANPFVNYLEAVCNSVDLDNKVAKCTSSISSSTGERRSFEIPYSKLIVAVGEQPASFGVPGVMEHCFFMKETRDAVRLRNRIQEVFELAALPGTTEEEVRRLLAFVIVGGGPTGVEFTGTLSDFLRQDLKRKFPSLMQYVSVTLLQSAQSILTQFDSRLAERALETFSKTDVNVRTGVRVVEVTENEVVLKSGERLPYGVCLWSAGNAPRQIVKDISQAIPDQSEFNIPGKLCIDPFLRVIGAKDVLALGDCSRIVSGPLPATAQVAAQQGAFAAHLLNREYDIGVGGIDVLPPSKLNSSLSLADRIFSTVTDSISSIDDGSIDEAVAKGRVILKKPFEFLSLGILASLGDDKAIAQVEAFDKKLPVWGSPAFLLWRSVYITKQVSLRNRVLILFDWLKVKVFGRDLSQF